MVKKKIIFFLPSLSGGGNEKNLIVLLNGLVKKNKFIIFLATCRNINKDKKLRKIYKIDSRVRILNASNNIKIKKGLLKYLHTALILLIFCIKNKTIIVSFQSNILALLVAKFTKSKIIIRLNTAPSKYINDIFNKNLFNFFYSCSDKILVNSIDHKKEVKKYFNLNCTVFRQSLDINKITKKAKEKINFSFFKNYRGLKVINIGNLWDYKDHITLLKAFYNLIKIKDSRLLIIGEGPQKIYIDNFIKRNKLFKYIKIIPFNSNPFNYLKLSDVKVLTSKYEGNPNVLLEAACLKRFIVSSDCKVGPSEILQRGKGGELFKVGDYKQLFLKLKNLDIKKIKNKKKIEISYKYVKTNYAADISQPFMKILKKI